MERAERIKELLKHRGEIDAELEAIRLQMVEEKQAFSKPRKPRTKKETA
jgi:hypothetical protein